MNLEEKFNDYLSYQEAVKEALIPGYKKDSVEFISGPSIEMVDLGLTSGTLWAKTNIGAQSETEAGLYFAWGETAQHEGWLADKSTHPYDWSEYQYAESDYNELTKYCNNSEYGYQGFTDGKTVLEATDDITTVALGAEYKMPTKAQFEELIEETNNEWTTINGVNGYKFTNKSDSSKYIFLPAAGACFDSYLDSVANEGHCWSSSLHEGDPNNARNLCFNNKKVNMGSYSRYYGFTVRPVRVAN